MSLTEEQSYDESLNIDEESDGEIDIFALAQQGEESNPMDSAPSTPATPARATQEAPVAPRKSRTIRSFDDEEIPATPTKLVKAEKEAEKSDSLPEEEPKSTSLSNRRRRQIADLDDEVATSVPAVARRAMGGGRRLQMSALDDDEGDVAPAKAIPNAAQVAAPSGNKVSQDKDMDLLADLLGDAEDEVVSVAPKKVVAAKNLLEDIMNDVEQSVSEQYFDRAAKEGPVSVLKELLPNDKSVRALSDEEATTIIESLVFMVNGKPYDSVTTGAKKIEMVNVDAGSKHTHIRVSRGSCVAAPSGVSVEKGDIAACNDAKFVQRTPFTVITYFLAPDFKKFDMIEILELINSLMLARGPHN